MASTASKARQPPNPPATNPKQAVGSSQPNPAAQDVQDEPRTRARTRLKRDFTPLYTATPQTALACLRSYLSRYATPSAALPAGTAAGVEARSRARASPRATDETNVPGVSAAGTREHSGRLRPRGSPAATARCVPSHMQAYRPAALSRVCLDPGDCHRRACAVIARRVLWAAGNVGPRGGTGWYPHLAPHKCP